LPKRKRIEKITFDWLNTSDKPYYPSIEDYRIQDKNPKKNLNILEVPMSMILTKTSYDRYPFRRYFDLSFKRELLIQNIDDLLKTCNLIVAIIHPMYLIESKQRNELYPHNFNDFNENLRLLCKKCDLLGKSIKCITLSEIPDNIKNTIKKN